MLNKTLKKDEEQNSVFLVLRPQRPQGPQRPRPFQLFFLLALAVLLFPSVSQASYFNLSPPKQETISDWQARLELARVLSYQKKYEESINEYKKVLQEKPDLVDAKLELASVYAYSEKPDEAKKILAGIPEQKWSQKQLEDLANVYASLKLYERAEQYYQQYFSQYPKDLKVRVKYAEMLSWEKKYEASIREFEAILKEKPDDIQVRRKYAFALIWMGNEEQGAEELRKTLSSTDK